MKKNTKTVGAIILLAAISKAYGNGDTVYVWFSDSPTLGTAPQSRVVAEVRDYDSANTAQVTFTTGEKVTDGASTAQRVFTTQALCAKAITDWVISTYGATAALDTGTTSGASTVAQPTTGLIRKS